jgi:hypothetical protein
MSVNRTSAQDNEATRIAAQKAAAELKKVSGVEEVDADGRAKAKFKNYMQPEDDEVAADNNPPPSPYQIQSSAYNARGPTDSGINIKSSIPSPAYSPPPNVNEVPVSSFDDLQQDNYSADDLPQGFQFYQDSDISDPYGPSTPPSDFVEQIPTQAQAPLKGTDTTKKAQEKDPILSKKPIAPVKPSAPLFASKPTKLDPNPFGPPGKMVAPKPQTSHISKTPHLAEKKDDQDLQGAGQFWNSEKKIQTPPPSTLSLKNEPTRKITGTPKTDELVDQPKMRQANVKPFEPVSERMEKDVAQQEQKVDKKQPVKKDTPDFIAPSQTTFPAGIQPMAEAAATAAAPFLSHDVRALYFEMIGRIFIAVEKSGVSTTHFTLNNLPKSSKFYGATIELSKYRSAPNEFNITLTGSSAAVSSFQQAIPELTKQFHDGKFNFTVHRIEANHEKPVYSRKDSQGDGSGSQDDSRDRRNQ